MTIAEQRFAFFRRKNSDVCETELQLLPLHQHMREAQRSVNCAAIIFSYFSVVTCNDTFWFYVCLLFMVILQPLGCQTFQQ